MLFATTNSNQGGKGEDCVNNIIVHSILENIRYQKQKFRWLLKVLFISYSLVIIIEFVTSETIVLDMQSKATNITTRSLN